MTQSIIELTYWYCMSAMWDVGVWVAWSVVLDPGRLLTGLLRAESAPVSTCFRVSLSCWARIMKFQPPGSDPRPLSRLGRRLRSGLTIIG